MDTAAIIPVFNEEKTVKDILTTLNNSKLIKKIIVINDASTDNTLKKVKSLKSKKLKIISLKTNIGKGGAVRLATENLKTDILFFCDGDLRNFREEHIKQTLEPFNYNKDVMSVGLRDYGLIGNFLSKNFLPLISGERALLYSTFKEMSKNPLIENYGLEPVMNNYCKKNDVPIYRTVLKDVKHTLKPKKWKKGIYPMVKETFQIIFVILKLKTMIKNY